MPNKDFVELKDSGKLNIVSTPYSNGIQYLGMNVTKPPFDNIKVRQAVAYAVPYQKIMDAVLFGLSKPMFGAKPGTPTEVAWPQPHGFDTDIAKAKQLMAEAGYPNGFETTLSFDLGFAGVNEPLCVLVQESLGQIGIKCTINKIPGATWRTELNKKVLPLYTNVFSGWLDYPEYFFIWCYHGKNSIFNTMSYQSKELDGYIDGAVTAAAEGNKAAYDKDVKGFVDLAFKDIPRIPIFQPYVNIAMQKNVSGYQYWFHRRLDYRSFVKASAGGIQGSSWLRAATCGVGAQRNAAMLSMVLKRMLLAVPSLIGVVIVTFLLTRALPGDPAAYFAGPAADKVAIEQIRVKLGLDQPLIVQFGRYVQDLGKGDLGQFADHRAAGRDRNQEPAAGIRGTDAAGPDRVDVDRDPARHLCGNAPLARWIDHACRVVATAGVSLPVFFLGLILVYVFYYLLGWSPAPLGRLDVFFSAPPQVTGFYLIDSLIAGEWDVPRRDQPAHPARR